MYSWRSSDMSSSFATRAGMPTRSTILLEDHNVTLCVSKTSPQHISADFVYLRFHGTEGNYRGKYSLDIMVEWCKRIVQWRDQGEAVYAHFNNDYQAHATQNARELKELMEEV
jgi:uncharacterized protein YecE (DUF72 family)